MAFITTTSHLPTHTLTEMDFMVHRVQYRSKLIALMFVLAILQSCQNKLGNVVHVAATNTFLKQQQGTLYFKNVPFTGIVYELFINGDTAKIMPYKNGKQDGITRWWHPNKQLAQERIFVNGRKEGVHKGWWPNGKPLFVYHFANDEYEGEVKEWFNTGKVFRIFHYEAGHEAGSQKMWWEDGKIRANYVIIKGEKFGLFGQKMCVNNIKS